jgi:hypothetical protein
MDEKHRKRQSRNGMWYVVLQAYMMAAKTVGICMSVRYSDVRAIRAGY